MRESPHHEEADENDEDMSDIMFAIETIGGIIVLLLCVVLAAFIWWFAS